MECAIREAHEELGVDVRDFLDEKFSVFKIYQGNTFILIIKHIRKGTTIISDCWGAYNRIESLCDIDGESMNYKHLTVNHREGFVNRTNRTIHTQAVERF